MSKKRKHKIKLEIGNFYRVLDERRDLKGRFSLFEIELKDGVDVSYPDIKKAGRTQMHQDDNRATTTSSTIIKSKHKKKGKKNA